MNKSHEFKALPLHEVRMKVTFAPFTAISSAQLAHLALKLGEDATWSPNPLALAQQIHFGFKSVNFECFFDGVVLDVVWSHSNGPYPRFESMLKTTVNVTQLINAPVQIVSMNYAVIEPRIAPEFGSVAEWVQVAVNTPAQYSYFHNCTLSGRIQGRTDLDLALNLYRFQDQGVVIETSCGSYTPNVESGLISVHEELFKFFGHLITERAKQEWQLQ